MREGLITNEFGQPASPITLTPILVESQIQRLAKSAEHLVKQLSPLDPKLAVNRKKISKELEVSTLSLLVCPLSLSLLVFPLSLSLFLFLLQEQNVREK